MTWVKIFWYRISGLKHTSWDFELDMSIKKSSFFLERITLLWLCLPRTCLEPHRGHTNVHLFGYDKDIRNHFRPSFNFREPLWAFWPILLNNPSYTNLPHRLFKTLILISLRTIRASREMSLCAKKIYLKMSVGVPKLWSSLFCGSRHQFSCSMPITKKKKKNREEKKKSKEKEKGKTQVAKREKRK